MTNDIRLSKHFMLSEFIRSSTASAKKINNTPSLKIISNLQSLCIEVLEPLREHFNCPIIISSGYRCRKLNSAVGGVVNSQHLTGEAADIYIPDEDTGKKWFDWIESRCNFDQLIWEKAAPSNSRHWIHVSFRACNEQGQASSQRHHVIRNLVKNP